MPKHDPTQTIDLVDDELEDALIEIEADTVEDAMAKLAADVGEKAEIVEARKVQRGGLGGFFARERVLLTARRPSSSGVPSVLDRLAESADAQDTHFATLLRRELADNHDDMGIGTLLDAAGWSDDAEAVAGVTEALRTAEEAPAPVAVGPQTETITIADDEGNTLAITPQAAVVSTGATAPALSPQWRLLESSDDPPGTGRLDWGMKELVRNGIPGPIISAVAALDSRDDLGWINGIADAVAPMCGPLPDEDVVVIGPDAETLGARLGLPVVNPGDMAPYEGSFCVQLMGGYDDREWLEYVRGSRRIHLVIDDEGMWRNLLVDDPAVVSWVGRRSLVDALYLATTLDATLGFGTIRPGEDAMVRARPVDVALSVRTLIRRR